MDSLSSLLVLALFCDVSSGISITVSFSLDTLTFVRERTFSSQPLRKDNLSFQLVVVK